MEEVEDGGGGPPPTARPRNAAAVTADMGGVLVGGREKRGEDSRVNLHKCPFMEKIRK